MSTTAVFSSNTSGKDDGFVSPLDLRRKAKLRTIAHALVTETVEAALAQCKPPPPSQSSSSQPPADASDPPRNSKISAGEVSIRKFAMTPPPSVAATATTTSLSNVNRGTTAAAAVAATGTSMLAAESQRGAVMPGATAAAAAVMTDASLLVRRWPSPEESVSHPLWKIPATPGQRSLREPTKQVAQLPGVATPGAAFGAAVTPPAPATAAAAGPSGGSEGGSRSPSLMGLGSPRPPGAVVSRRREARRELAVNDADERMSWSSFDSLDVRVDDQVGATTYSGQHNHPLPPCAFAH